MPTQPRRSLRWTITFTMFVMVAVDVPAIAGHTARAATAITADSRDEDTFDDDFRNTGWRAGGTICQIEIADRGA